MSGWQNPDVTPAGAPPAAPPPGVGAYVPPPAPPPQVPADPFGSRPGGRRHGRVRRWLGAVLVAVSVVALVVGVVQAAVAGGDLEGDALGVGAVADDETEDITFTAPAAGDYTVWARFEGFREREENRRDRTVADIVCDIDLPDGDRARIRGDRQGHAADIGKHSTIGWFSSPPGEVTVRCAYESYYGTNRADQVELLVVEGKPSLASFVVLFAAIAGLVLGIFVVVWGFSARSRRW